jgi:hypothetical protein
MRIICLFIFLIPCGLLSGGQAWMSERGAAQDFRIVAGQSATGILMDGADDALVSIAASLFADDVQRVTGKKPAISNKLKASEFIILAGTIEHSAFIRQLISSRKLNVDSIRNKWDAYQIQVIKNPFQGVKQALVIVGANKRGVAYGLMELSGQMGVSPWYWWADVPVKTQTALYLPAGFYVRDAPKVKYRGIFINDEAPALSGWSRATFGGFNHDFYVKVFELILRCKGNYLWPAMWGNAFNNDDSLNPVLADKWGIVMGTSHHEPMVRSQQEWKRFGSGPWDYEKNEEGLKKFWKKGIENMGKKESIVTVGMRGDGDMPMSAQTATTLLERIVADQRNILTDATGKPAAETPQLWALYKEVQDYYDKGMRVPDDVTLLLCDDNWGNIRKLPRLSDKPRSGGYGIYYHFDYVGGPRNYKWLNTNNLSRVWEQMHLAYSYGVDRIWIVNVGDIKPMELPISFFLDYAWDPEKWNEDNISTYYSNWAAAQFGKAHSQIIGDVLRRYAQYSSTRKPELLNDRTYSLSNYHEADRVLSDWQKLEADALEAAKQLAADAQDAYYQLVLHPVEAMANLHRMYHAVAMNKYLATKGDIKANAYAAEVKGLYEKDSLITLKYHSIAGGKWKFMMSQTHIGYTGWQEPRQNRLPAVSIIAEGMQPTPDSFGIAISSSKANIPPGDTSTVFFEQDGYVSMIAAHWTSVFNTSAITWKVIPDIGRRESGITTFPVTASSQLSGNSPHVRYDFYSYDSGAVQLQLYFSPTLNFHNDGGLKFAVSIDDGPPVTVTLNDNDMEKKEWNAWVANNAIVKNVDASVQHAGRHILKYWMISPAVILQKLVVNFGGSKPSYLGPPETRK